MHNEIPEEKIFFTEMQTVTIQDLDVAGYILDIGGGGEGIIGGLKGSEVIAIDLSRRELEEAPAGPLKIVMDARDLQFLDETFHVATSFFTLLYIEPADRKKVFQEIHRVLKPNGRFLLWDTVIPSQGVEEKEFFAVRLKVTLPREEIQTGYGVPWKDREQDVQYYIDLAEKTGFEVMDREEHDQVYFLELKKK